MFMKNFFLYIKSRPSEQPICESEDIFCFKNNKILAIDKSIYDAKNRAELQKSIGMHPYYITQSIFKEFLHFTSVEKQLSILLKDIQFIDDSIDTSIEYSDLQENIRKGDANYFNQNIFEIMNIYDTDIKSMVVRYGGYDFSISNEGVISTDAPKNILESFVEDEAINKIILGAY